MRPVDTHLGCWIDGRKASADEACVSVEDPSVQSGWGVFETLAVRSGRALDVAEHLARLREGADRLGIELPSRQDLLTVIERVSGEAPAFGWLKIVVVSSGKSFTFAGSMDPEDEGRPASAVLLPWRRSLLDPLVGLKTLSYASNRLGQQWATERGADDGLWLNTRGHLAEGCSSNLFVVEHRKLFTAAPSDGILAGVVRQRVLEAARDLGIIVHEGKLRLRRLERAREAFLTSSLRGIRPLVRFEGRQIGQGDAGPLTLKLTERVASIRNAGGLRP